MRTVCVSLLFLLALIERNQCFDHYNEESGDSESGSGSGNSDDEQIVKRNQIIQQPSVTRAVQILAQQRSNQENPDSASHKTSYPQILNVSVDILLKDRLTPQTVKNVLLKYYFTGEKEMSIWPLAVEESEKTLNAEFSERELFEMENDVKSIYRRMLECDLLLKSRKTVTKKIRRRYAKCYQTLRDYIDDGFTDFGFPRGTVEGQGKMLQLSLAYNIMSLLVLRMSQAVAENARIKSFKAAKSIFDIAENVVTSVKTVTKNTIDARIQAISQIEICLMQDVLWQEFQVTCEFRMKRDVDTASGIGGSPDKFKQKYRAKVIDAVTKKEVCNVAISTSPTQDKEAVKSQLTKTCAKLRDSYARTIKDQIENFYAVRTLPAVKKLPSLWNNDKTKLKEIKNRLATKF